MQRETGQNWWADELWTIESVWTPVGQRLWIAFLVDPMHDGLRRRGEHVWAVGVTKSAPSNASEVSSTAVPFRNEWESHVEELLAHIRRFREEATDPIGTGTLSRYADKNDESNTDYDSGATQKD